LIGSDESSQKEGKSAAKKAAQPGPNALSVSQWPLRSGRQKIHQHQGDGLSAKAAPLAKTAILS